MKNTFFSSCFVEDRKQFLLCSTAISFHKAVPLLFLCGLNKVDERVEKQGFLFVIVCWLGRFLASLRYKQAFNGILELFFCYIFSIHCLVSYSYLLMLATCFLPVTYSKMIVFLYAFSFSCFCSFNAIVASMSAHLASI